MDEIRVMPNSIKFPIGVWYDKRQDQIHIAGPRGADFHTTVNNNPNSIRCHENLYNHLKRLLEEHGCWPQEATGEDNFFEEPEPFSNYETENLRMLKELLDERILTDEEYQAKKQKLLTRL